MSFDTGQFYLSRNIFLALFKVICQIGFEVYKRGKRFQNFISKDKVFSKYNDKNFDLNFRFVHL